MCDLSADNLNLKILPIFHGELKVMTHEVSPNLHSDSCVGCLFFSHFVTNQRDGLKPCDYFNLASISSKFEYGRIILVALNSFSFLLVNNHNN